MKAKDVKLWYASVSVLIASVLPFFWFMYRPMVNTLVVSLSVIAVATVFYVIATKRITHPKDKYTAVQAMKFADLCMKEGLKNPENFRENREKFLQVAAANDFSAKLEYMQLVEMFKIGRRLQKEMKGSK